MSRRERKPDMTRVQVERREIGPRRGGNGAGVSEADPPATVVVESLPRASVGPLAKEVAKMLSDRPIRFPSVLL